MSVRSIDPRLLEGGYDIRTVQGLLGHKDVKTTMIYTPCAQPRASWRSQPDGHALKRTWRILCRPV
jgi:integrase